MSLFEKKFEPMLLREMKEAFDSKDYLFEMKYDGVRALIFVSPSSFHIYNRHQKDMTFLFPELKEMQKMVTKPVIFDGEIVAFQNGVPSFLKLQSRIHLKNSNKIKLAQDTCPILYIAFDVLYDGMDLTGLPLIKRKKVLNRYKDTTYFMKSFTVDTYGIAFFQKIKKKKLEGIVAKEKKSVYEINTRSEKWIKIKNIQREIFWIGGYQDREDTPFFSVLLGEYVNHHFQYVGKVSVPKKDKLYSLIKQVRLRKTSPFSLDFPFCYVTPKISCFVEFLERSEEGILRHPVYRGIAT